MYGDRKNVVPVSDELFAVYRNFYSYDWTPLEPKAEGVDDGSPYWREESVSIAAAYGRERVPARLFLPKNATPPYQTIVPFPSAYSSVPARATSWTSRTSTTSSEAGGPS